MSALYRKSPSLATEAFIFGAQEKTRTSTPLRALGPEPSASTNSATWALQLRYNNVAPFTEGRNIIKPRHGVNQKYEKNGSDGQISS